MSEENKNSGESSFKDQIMRSLDESRKKRGQDDATEPARKVSLSSDKIRESRFRGRISTDNNKENEETVRRIERTPRIEKINHQAEEKEQTEKRSTDFYEKMLEKAEQEKSDRKENRKKELEPTVFRKINQKFDSLQEENLPRKRSASEENNLKKTRRRKEDRVVRKIVYVLTIAILIIAGIVVISGYNYVSAGLKPLDTNDSKLVQVEVPSGSSNRQIGEILQEDEVIRSGLIFNFYTKFKNLTNFQSGYYHFSADMTLDKISKELQQGGSAEPLDDATKLTIPEGYDVDQIGTLIAKKTDFKKADFISLMQDQDFFSELEAAYPSLLTDAGAATDVRYRLEGYLFPATYNVHSDTTLQDLVYQMVDATNNILTPYYSQITEKGLNVQEVMTLASLVEKEGVTESDRKNIAQVFFNRIDAGMALQSDISILYALGEHKENVTYKDTEVDSPYNLYINLGYGPGPFDNPSEQAIQAVLNPTANDYYYFVADTSTGKVYYAETYDEHLALVEKYVNN